MAAAATAAVALAAGLELAVGEPPERVHPVTWFGRVVSWIDREWTGSALAGAVVALALPLFAAGTVAGAVALTDVLHPIAGVAVAGLALFSTTSLRMLLAVARRVIEESERDPETARVGLRALVGRDASALSADEIRSAAVESTAENLADGLVAPLGAFAVCAPFSLSLAAGAAAWVKAVNTLDSMLGYPTTAYGGASARLDDLAMWVPARASAALIALAAGRPAALWRARRWAHAPSSPNSGWPMATLAAVLDARLEKPGAYALNPRVALPTVADARRGMGIVGRTGGLYYALAGAIAWL